MGFDTRRGDLLHFTLHCSGLPNVDLGNLKWLDSWETRIQRKTHVKKIASGGKTLTDVELIEPGAEQLQFCSSSHPFEFLILWLYEYMSDDFQIFSFVYLVSM